MDFSDSSIDCSALVASIADICMKPWKHAVVLEDFQSNKSLASDTPLELNMRIETRNVEGERFPENDLDLEIFRSGKHLNLMLCWSNQLDRPILWQGQHAVWMDGNNGKRCQAPLDGAALEALARRLRALFDVPDEV